VRLLVDATAYAHPPGGSGLRARELYGALAARGDHEIVFCLARETPADLVPPGCEARRLRVRRRRRGARWWGIRPPDDGDLWLTDHFPVHASLPTVLTVHDRGGGRLRRRLMQRQMRRAAAVVAVSETVRAAWGFDLRVVPNGVRPPDPLPQVEPGRHLLAVDPGLRHKGIARARRLAADAGLELVEVGRGARWLGREEWWRELARAAAVLCPSDEEGFGMVPLEALCLGRPVLCSDIAAHREVCGDAAWLVARDDPQGWRLALEVALRAPPERLERGRQRAREWTWEGAAARLDAVLKAVGPPGTPRDPALSR